MFKITYCTMTYFKDFIGLENLKLRYFFDLISSIGFQTERKSNTENGAITENPIC